MEELSIEEKIEDELESIRPYLYSEGGDCEFVKFEDGIVYIKMLGACEGCYLADFTVKEGIEALLISEIPEVKAVVQI